MLATRASRDKRKAQADAVAAGQATFVYPCAIHGERAVSDSAYGWCIECRSMAAAHSKAKAERKAARLGELRSDPEAVARMRAQAINYGAIDRMRRQGRPERALPSPETLRDVVEFARLYPLGATFDHIVPLKGKTVCGLHVWYNLQPTCGESNSIKNARFDPERFPEQRPCNGLPGGQYHGEEGVAQLERFLRMDIPIYGLGLHLIADAAPTAKGPQKAPKKTQRATPGRKTKARRPTK